MPVCARLRSWKYSIFTIRDARVQHSHTDGKSEKCGEKAAGSYRPLYQPPFLHPTPFLIPLESLLFFFFLSPCFSLSFSFFLFHLRFSFHDSLFRLVVPPLSPSSFPPPDRGIKLRRWEARKMAIPGTYDIRAAGHEHEAYSLGIVFLGPRGVTPRVGCPRPRANRLVLHIQLIQPALFRRPRSFRPFRGDRELDGPPRGHGDSCHMARTRPLCPFLTRFLILPSAFDSRFLLSQLLRTIVFFPFCFERANEICVSLIVGSRYLTLVN